MSIVYALRYITTADVLYILLYVATYTTVVVVFQQIGYVWLHSVCRHLKCAQILIIIRSLKMVRYSKCNTYKCAITVVSIAYTTIGITSDMKYAILIII